MSIFGDVVDFASSAVSTVAHAASDVVQTVSPVASLMVEAVGVVTKNPLWDVVKTGASFVPGIGTAVSSGMAIAAGIGSGESVGNIMLKAAREALPGGPIVKLGWDVGVGLAGKALDSADVKTAEAELVKVAKENGANQADAVAALHSAIEAVTAKPKTPEALAQWFKAKRTSVTSGVLRARMQAQKVARQTGKPYVDPYPGMPHYADTIQAQAVEVLKARKKTPLVSPKIKIDPAVHKKNVADFKKRMAAYGTFVHVAKIDAMAQANKPKAVAWVNAVKTSAKKGNKTSIAILSALELAKKHATEAKSAAKMRASGVEIDGGNSWDSGAWYYERPYPDGETNGATSAFDHTFWLGIRAQVGPDVPPESRKGNWFFSYPAH